MNIDTFRQIVDCWSTLGQVSRDLSPETRIQEVMVQAAHMHAEGEYEEDKQLVRAAKSLLFAASWLQKSLRGGLL